MQKSSNLRGTPFAPFPFAPALALVLCLLALLLGSCGRKTVAMQYQPVSATSWTRADTIVFSVDSVHSDGEYQLQLGVRADNTYPFTNLALAMTRRIQPRGTERRDTLALRLVSQTGHWRGDGVNLYQYLFPLDTLYLAHGDTLTLAIHHIMRRDTLPGISDLGLQMSKME